MSYTEQVSFANKEILNTMAKGLFDNKTREEVLLKSPEMDLLATFAFVEAKETAKRSAGVLMEASMASSTKSAPSTSPETSRRTSLRINAVTAGELDTEGEQAWIYRRKTAKPMESRATSD